MTGDSLGLAIIIQSDAYGGTERHTLDFASHIDSKGLQVEFLYCGEGFNGYIPKIYSSIKVSKINSKVQNITLKDIKIWHKHFKKNNVKRALFIKPSYFSVDLKFLLLLRYFYKDLIVIEHSLPPRRPPITRVGFLPKMGFWRFKNEFLRYCFAKLVDKVITVSELARKELSENTYYKDINVCGNGINIDSWVRDTEKGNEFRSRIGINSDVHLFGCVGNLFTVKSFHVAILALGLISEKNKKRCVLCIIGVGPEGDRLKELAEKLGVENVYFVGKQIDMLAAYSAMQTLLVTSTSEANSLAVLEAIACGCYVLSSDVGICAEVIKEMNNGVIIKSHDPEAWAEAIEVHLNESHFKDEVLHLSRESEFKKKYDTKKTMSKLISTIMEKS
jgi:glycosyltransferase involved in cell wall biosynthesis